MANLVRPLLRSALRILSGVFVRPHPSGGIPGVIVHDPNAQKPKDFDNPFYTAASQERMGDLIARSVTGSKPR
jgi:hypothetical protein